ncbi:aldolase/citrate lyase family protein [Cupriavidus basilensis]
MASPYAAEVLAGAGFDWLLIDGEHAPNTVPSILAQLQALAAYPVQPVVRASWNDTVQIKQLLDLGVQTLLVPMVQDAAEAAAAVAATRYPRKACAAWAARWRAPRAGTASMATWAAPTREMCVLVQVETRAGLEHLDEIAATEGVDGVFIGPADLAADLGHLGNPGHAEYRAPSPTPSRAFAVPARGGHSQR